MKRASRPAGLVPVVVLAGASLAACGGPASEVEAVTGTATYRERMALGPDAELRVAVLDVSRQDVAADTLAAATLRDVGQVPIAFSIAYDPDQVDPSATYAVRASIHDRERMLFTTTRAVHVLTRGNPDTVALVLERVGARGSQRPDGSGDWRAKIGFDLDALDDEGLRGPPDGRRAVTYEFCVPDDSSAVAEIGAIDPTLEFQPGSPGRAGCGSDRILAVGHTGHPAWRRTLESLARRRDVERILEFVGE